MKTSVATLAFLSCVAAASAANPTIIDVSCPDVDFRNLSADEESYAALAVQFAFNKANVGKALSNFAWFGARPDESALDDVQSTWPMASFVGELGYLSDATIAAWEMELVEVLRLSPGVAFKNIEGCSIDAPISTAFEEEDLAIPLAKDLRVSLAVSCTPPIGGIAGTASHYSADVLADSFDLVHKRIDGDFLEDIHPLGDDMIPQNLRTGRALQSDTNGWIYMGGVNCRWCREFFSS